LSFFPFIVFFLFFSDFFSDAHCNSVCGIGTVDFVCTYGQSISFQWCPFNSGHGSIAFLLQQGVQFGIGVGVMMHHFPVLKLTQEWGIKK
jgi:hypothetical protein